jgi:predicted site-specific integrase-resolvase
MKQTVGLKELAAKARITLTHGYRLTYEGKFPGARKRDGVWEIPVSDVRKFMKERRRRKARKRQSSGKNQNTGTCCGAKGEIQNA